MIPYLVTVLILIFILSQAIKILNEYERGVIFRLGRLIPSKGPGKIFLIPLVDKLQKLSLRLVALEVPPQDVITRDNVSLRLTLWCTIALWIPTVQWWKSGDYAYATSQLAQTTLRSVLWTGRAG